MTELFTGHDHTTGACDLCVVSGQQLGYEKEQKQALLQSGFFHNFQEFSLQYKSLLLPKQKYDNDCGPTVFEYFGYNLRELVGQKEMSNKDIERFVPGATSVELVDAIDFTRPMAILVGDKTKPMQASGNHWIGVDNGAIYCPSAGGMITVETLLERNKSKPLAIYQFDDMREKRN